MKLLLVTSLLMLLVSCGIKINEQTPNNQYRGFEPVVVQTEDLTRIKSVCSSLTRKEDRLSVLVSSIYTFDYAQKGCNDEGLGAMKAIEVSIQRPYSEYIFKKNNGELFAFPNVETSSKGVMAEICSNLMDLKSPMQTPTGAIWFTSLVRKADCTSDSQHVCIHIQRGSAAGMGYEIHTEEWIKFKINNERTGFFTERRIVSGADCPAGKTIERKAVLK